MAMTRRSFWLGAMAVAGCKIEPALQSQVGARLAMRLPEPSGRRNFLFNQELERYIDHDPAARYALSYSIGTSTLSVSSRDQITATLRYTASDVEAGRIVITGDKKTVVTYRKGANSMISTLVTDDAMARYIGDLALQLADVLRRELAP